MKSTTNMICAVLLVGLVGGTLFHQASATTYNSTTACFRGSEQNLFYRASCSDDENLGVNTTELSLIAVHRAFYGTKANSEQCPDNGTAEECCQYVENQDCFFTGPLTDSMLACSGFLECSAEGNQRNTDNCHLKSLFDDNRRTTFGHIEYECINVGLLTDMCHEGIIENRESLYIASNIYFQNDEHIDKTCTCRVTTSCGASVIVEAVRVDLAKTSSQCIENMTFVDGRDASVTHTTTCYDKKLYALLKLFESESNLLDINLNINGNHSGKVWIKVRASWSNATVQVRCGLTSALATDPDHQCPVDLTTTIPVPTTTTTQVPTTTIPLKAVPCSKTDDDKESDDGCQEQEKDEPVAGLGIGAIAGIIAAGVVLLLVLIVILVLVFRRHRPTSHPDYDIPYMHDPTYETLKRYDNAAHGGAGGAYSNPAYNNEKMPPPEGATPDYDTLQPPPEYTPYSPQYDNSTNESIMTISGTV